VCLHVKDGGYINKQRDCQSEHKWKSLKFKGKDFPVLCQRRHRGGREEWTHLRLN
jgi:hypothetical protein